MQLRRQTARRIGENDVDAARLRRLNRIENHGGGIAFFLRNHRDIIALAPYHQLLARRSAKGIACRKQHRLALGLIPLRQFADGGGLAGAVDADEHDDFRLRGIG